MYLRYIIRIMYIYNAVLINIAFITVSNTVNKSSQVTFIYIALLTIQIVSKHLTVSNWRIECQ